MPSLAHLGQELGRRGGTGSPPWLQEGPCAGAHLGAPESQALSSRGQGGNNDVAGRIPKLPSRRVHSRQLLSVVYLWETLKWVRWREALPTPDLSRPLLWVVPIPVSYTEGGSCPGAVQPRRPVGVPVLGRSLSSPPQQDRVPKCHCPARLLEEVALPREAGCQAGQGACACRGLRVWPVSHHGGGPCRPARLRKRW